MKRKQVYVSPELQVLMRPRRSSLLTSLSASGDVGDFGWEDSYAGDFDGDSPDSDVGGFGGSGSGAGNFGSGTW